MGKKDFPEDKKLCKLAKDVEEYMEDYFSLMDKPRFLCRKCGRVANDKQNLCKPEKMDK